MPVSAYEQDKTAAYASNDISTLAIGDLVKRRKACFREIDRLNKQIKREKRKKKEAMNDLAVAQEKASRP
jgi:uncharacterized small protein (DUF1192 family)